MPVLISLYWRLKSSILVRACGAVLACAMLWSFQLPASREYQIKAAFLFNFTQFVEWPDGSFENPNTPLIIGVLGEDPFGTSLTETVKGEKINGHPLLVQHYDNVKEIRGCHILFINMAGTEKVKETLTMIRGRHILTVSDTPGFIAQGGLIRFITENNKIRFQINQEAARGDDISISSKLLRLAEIVKAPK